MPVIAVVFDTKQSFIGWLCIGQYITGCGAVHKTLFQKETDKPTLRDKQLFGGGAEVGTMNIIKSRRELNFWLTPNFAPLQTECKQ